MSDKLNHRERLLTILAGEEPDRFAASFWRHYFHREISAEKTAAAMLEFQNEFDWDFMKINPRADYHIQDWGLELEYSTDEFAKHTKTGFPINSVDDWFKIEPLKLSAPALDEHLRLVSIIRKEVGPDLPLLMTVFTPLSLAGRMIPDRTKLVEVIRDNPDALHSALGAITETYKSFASELRNAGADGLFFATLQWASSNMITFDEYKEFGVQYDLPVIEAAGEDAINLFHVCDTNNFLAELAPYDYLSAMYNWDANDSTNPSLQEGLEMLDNRTILGGFPYNDKLVSATTDEIEQTMRELKNSFSPSDLIIGPGCAIPPETSAINLTTIRKNL